MNILIIGSSGFIGRNLTKNLVSQKNCSVYGIDIKSNKEFAGKKIYIGNIKESAFLKKCIKESKPNLIYYLISFFSSKNSEDFTNSYGESLAYLKNLFQNLDYSHRLVYVGSSAQYGRVPSNFQPVNENVGFYPASSYGLFKIFEENEIKKLAEESKVEIVGARIFNVTGPGEPERMVGGSIISQLMLSDKIKLGNLMSKRDFLDVRDVANALVVIGKKGKKNEVYNVCSGKSTSIKDYIKLISKELEIEPIIIFDKKKYKKNDIKDLVGDNSKLVKELNWKIRYSLPKTIKDIIKEIDN